VLCLVIGYGVLFSLWKNVARPFHPALRLVWLIPIVIAIFDIRRDRAESRRGSLFPRTQAL